MQARHCRTVARLDRHALLNRDVVLRVKSAVRARQTPMMRQTLAHRRKAVSMHDPRHRCAQKAKQRRFQSPRYRHGCAPP